ncbi:MAG TPA: adenylate/guanylate cyclase domain-containing protein [Anaerolineae bacterium]|nr:adenylate/guanylate cyclase domain-containing protein [Anaerolineae bacterium]
MASPATLERLATYVPTPVAQVVYQSPETFPEHSGPRRFPAAILFSDISGFSQLTENFQKIEAGTPGEARLAATGAEELMFLINRYFSALIEISRQFHGQVVKFSGDALTILFPADEVDLATAVRRAGECALAMQAKMSDFTVVKTSRGSASLSMKVGVGAGTLLTCSVGGELNRWEYVVAGEPITEMAVAEQGAEPGQIVLGATAWHAASEYLDGRLLPTGNLMQLLAVREPLPLSEPTRLDWTKLTPEQQKAAAQALQLYVPGAIKARMDAQAEWLAELRRMSIVFVGIGGLDYEASDAAERLQRFLQTAQKVLYRYEGSLNKVAVDDKGTVILVLFGAPPMSHEDEPTRAILFALELQTVAKEQSLRVAIGITEGTMFAGPVGARDRREYTVIGHEVNLAARFMQYGRAGTIIVSDRVKERATRAFITEDLGFISVKGRQQSQRAHLIKAERGSEQEFVLRYLMREDIFVGRKGELERTRRAAARARAGKLQLLIIRGELGIGKSRLASEMVREWLTEGGVGYGGRCISYDRQTPYRVWRDVLLTIYGITPSLSPERQLIRLSNGIAELETPSGQPDYWVNRLPLLADVLGLDAPDTRFTETISGQIRRNNSFALIEALLKREAKRRPVLILLEDVHWADELSLALAAYLAKTLIDAPVLLALVQRQMPAPNLVEELTQFSHATTIDLGPLDREECLDLIKVLFDDIELSFEAQQTLLVRSQGNPFFLQEMAGSLLNGMGSQRVTLTDLVHTLNLPDTVQDVILSRIDRLAEAEKLTLKIASVIGTRFQRALLSEVHPAAHTGLSLSDQLTRLEAEKLIRLENADPKWEYDFSNVTVQEVVYEGLLHTQRRQLHGLVGTALEKLVPDELERLAYHFSRSNSWRKALYYLKASGDKARREYANLAAINYYTEFLHFIASQPGRDEKLSVMSTEYWDVLYERAKLYNLVGRRMEEMEDLDTLGVLSEALRDDYRRALSTKQWAHTYANSGDYDSGLEVIERSVRLAESAGAEKLIGEGYNLWGKLLYIRGDYKTADSYLQHALYIAQQQKDLAAQADCLNSLGVVAHYQADYDVAFYFFQEAIELYQVLGDQVGLGNTLTNLAEIHYDTGHLMLALKDCNTALSMHQAIGDRAGEALAQLNMGQIRRTCGDYATADTLFKSALKTYELIEDRRHEARCLYNLGFLYCRLEDYPQALAYLSRAKVILEELDDPWALGRALNYQAWTLYYQEDYKQARSVIETSLRLKHETPQRVAVIEDLICLAKITLARRDLSLAETCVRHILSFVENSGVKGVEHPVQLYLTAHQVLQLNCQPDQAQAVLVAGKEYLSAQLSRIDDPVLKYAYLHAVPENKTLYELGNEKAL